MTPVPGVTVGAASAVPCMCRGSARAQSGVKTPRPEQQAPLCTSMPLTTGRSHAGSLLGCPLNPRGLTSLRFPAWKGWQAHRNAHSPRPRQNR